MKIQRQKMKCAYAQIARLFKPERIALFGSHAYGRSAADSDVDLLVVMPFEGKGFRKVSENRTRIDADFQPDWWCARLKRSAAGWQAGLLSCEKSPGKAHCFMQPDVAEVLKIAMLLRAEIPWSLGLTAKQMRRIK